VNKAEQISRKKLKRRKMNETTLLCGADLNLEGGPSREIAVLLWWTEKEKSPVGEVRVRGQGGLVHEEGRVRLAVCVMSERWE